MEGGLAEEGEMGVSRQRKLCSEVPEMRVNVFLSRCVATMQVRGVQGCLGSKLEKGDVQKEVP